MPVGEGALLQAFRIGNTIWISTPCDFSCELALPIKDRLKTLGAQGVITSFNGNYLGYVIPGRYYHMDTYESRTMSFFGPTVPDYFEDLIRRMTTSLLLP